ncbi:MAG: PilN domain-containing protein [Steroidobacteraceae bacterium]
MPRINLLPWREVERKRKRQEFGMAAGVAVLLAVLTGFVLRWQYASIIDNQNNRNQYLKDEIAQVDKQIVEILDLEQQKQRLQSRIQVIEQLQSGRPEVVHLFDQLVRLLPDGVYLTSIKQTDRRIQIKGIAESSTRVSTFMKNIDTSEWLKDPFLEIVETKGTGDAGSSFTLYANQVATKTSADKDKDAKAAVSTRKSKEAA